MKFKSTIRVILLLIPLWGCHTPAAPPDKTTPPDTKHMVLYQRTEIDDPVIQPPLEVIKGDLLLVYCEGRNKRLKAHTLVSDEMHNRWFEYSKDNFQAIANAEGSDVVTCKYGNISFQEFEPPGDDTQP